MTCIKHWNTFKSKPNHVIKNQQVTDRKVWVGMETTARCCFWEGETFQTDFIPNIVNNYGWESSDTQEKREEHEYNKYLHV